MDVDVLCDWADRLIGARPLPRDVDVSGWYPGCLKLLPGRYDDWAVFERERRRQLLLHALESLARLLIGDGRPGEAVLAASAVVAGEPPRESAQRVLLEAHLAEGHISEAQRSFVIYERLALAELGVSPGTALRVLARGVPVGDPTPGARRRQRATMARSFR